MSWSNILKRKTAYYKMPTTSPVDEAVTVLAKALADDFIEKELEEYKNKVPTSPKSSKYDYQYSGYDEETKDEFAQHEKNQEIALKEVIYDDLVSNIEGKIFDSFEEIFKEGYIENEDGMGGSSGVLVLINAIDSNWKKLMDRKLEW